jgi:phosphoribosylcarboxyaminoimidazole (NCAIR) mutase
MGSPSDEDYCKKIAKHSKELGLTCQLRVTSAHKGTEETLKILAQYEGMWINFYVSLSVRVKLYPKCYCHTVMVQWE